MSDPIFSLNAVHIDIAQYHILQGVDLEVPGGQVTMLWRRNGGQDHDAQSDHWAVDRQIWRYSLRRTSQTPAVL